MASYWCTIFARALGSSWTMRRDQLIGLIIGVLILYTQLRLGIVTTGGAVRSWFSLIWPYVAITVAIYVRHVFKEIHADHVEQCQRQELLKTKAKEFVRFKAANALLEFMVRILQAANETHLSLRPFSPIKEYDLDPKKREVQVDTLRFQILYDEYLRLRNHFALPIQDPPVDRLPVVTQADLEKDQLIRCLRVHIEALRSYGQRLQEELIKDPQIDF